MNTFRRYSYTLDFFKTKVYFPSGVGVSLFRLGKSETWKKVSEGNEILQQKLRYILLQTEYCTTWYKLFDFI